ncbi:hypothetical protein A3C37_01705 [Candidatus Peribacteria bacterium RIFCSPHIGHO2_02_FULL_53_20]|nr:MAG: hypothetical protein A3C37_01705 [Candidatus Peribacteria bacterium RIFCSPHIGHO2_02_FULL_53_20]OGJ67681.1 MAG: hypothetical protein A3B61_05360 [Candidatus Peribacteria bacterium RIFCSPLOWO2_01_FULL_53_10]
MSNSLSSTEKPTDSGLGADMTASVIAAVTNMRTEHADRIWDLCPEIARRVEEEYAALAADGKKINHHDFAHAKRVGEIARQVAKDEWGDEHIAKLAGIAGLVHNADRIIQAQKGIGRREVSRDEVIALVKKWIENNLEETDVLTVLDAVLGHDGRNSEEDSPVKIALQDGDRVVNLDADLFPRSGQYYSDLPVVDFKHFLNDPEATYRNPKTVLRDINYSLDWVKSESGVCVRTKLGMEMAQQRAKVFTLFFEVLKAQLAQEGIDME